MNRFKILLTLVMLCVLFQAHAQLPKNFSPDLALFPSEVSQLFVTFPDKQRQEEVYRAMEQFTSLWNSGALAEQEKNIVFENANLMLNGKVKPDPYFFYYISIVNKLAQKGGKESLALWSEAFDRRMQGARLREVQEFLEQHDRFLRKGILYQSSSITWKVSDTNFLLQYDTAVSYVIRNTRLVCFSGKDSSVIDGTGGSFFPGISGWEGMKGKVTWEKVRLSKDTVYALLNAYRIVLSNSGFSADSVIFYNKKYFSNPLYGSFEDRVMSAAPSESTTYPRFSSYMRNYEIRNIFRNIDYLGGFSMQGSKLIGSGETDDNAMLTITKDSRKIMILRSNAFTIQGDRISSNPTGMVLFTSQDSIYHPGLQMKYLDKTRELSLFRPQGGISNSPFFNSYHNVDMDCGALNWNLDRDIIKFESMKGINRLSTAVFTSNLHYAINDFYRIQGIDERNPLYVLKNFVETFSTEEIMPGMLAQYMKKPEDQVKAMLIRLSIRGFLYYDLVNEKAVVQDRLYHYIEANSGRQDYDVIRINSETYDASNADLNLGNLDLLIRGVSEVFLSDSQNVYIYPEKKEILMKKGMDFVFTGSVKAGLFDFYAHECFFQYDSFKIILPNIDSLAFKVKVPGENPYDPVRYKQVESVIEDLGGVILIDHPTNKSGLKEFPEYPVFLSERESFVYYDKNPVYKRDFFNYKVAPFVLDSLDNFSTDNLSFEGVFTSGGIFPEIEQPLKVQSDYSLGFINESPAEGYPVYGGKGRFSDKVDLSNLGLRASGTLDYLTGEVHSDDFLFQPDNMTALPVKSLSIRDQVRPVEYPIVKAELVDLTWKPYRDTMVFKDREAPFRMYNDQVEMHGELTYSDLAMTGDGNISFENSKMESKYFSFGRNTIDSDTVNFSVYGPEKDKPAVSTLIYTAHVDLLKRKVDFRSSSQESKVTFPYNQYDCHMEAINWSMDNNQMLFANNILKRYPRINQLSSEDLIDLDIVGSDFVSTDPAKDSLRFWCTGAKYDLDDYIIYAEGVRIIRAADAAIFPDSAKLVIDITGKMKRLSNAEIIADTNTRNHHIYRANVDVISRNEYRGDGIYKYRSPGRPVQEIPFAEIGSDAYGRTYARSVVEGIRELWLNPYFEFSGEVHLDAGQPLLNFEGGFRILEDCYARQTPGWTYFKAPVDPRNVRIPLEQPLRTIEGEEQELTIFISDFDEEVFTSVFDQRKQIGDTAMFNGSGTISFDTLTRAYRVFDGDEFDLSRIDQYFTLNNRTCIVEASGPVSLGVDYGYIDMEMFGDLTYMIVPDSLELNLSAGMDFYFDDNALEQMADSIVTSNLRGIDLNHPREQAMLRHYLGPEGTKALKDDISTFGTLRKLPDELARTFLLSGISLFWNSVSRSYVSRGPIGVISAGEKPVVRYMNGYLEILRRRSGDGMTLYLEITPLKWYFFDYRNGIMQTISSDPEYNNRISMIKESKRKKNRIGMEENYEYVISTEQKAIDFLRRMEVLSK